MTSQHPDYLICQHHRPQCAECRMASDAREAELEHLHERDALHTEARGMLGQELDAARLRASEAHTVAMHWQQCAINARVALETADHIIARLTSGRGG